MSALRFRLRGDDAPKLPTAAGRHPTRVSHAVQRVRFATRYSKLARQTHASRRLRFAAQTPHRRPLQRCQAPRVGTHRPAIMRRPRPQLALTYWQVLRRFLAVLNSLPYHAHAGLIEGASEFRKTPTVRNDQAIERQRIRLDHHRREGSQLVREPIGGGLSNVGTTVRSQVPRACCRT